MNELPRRNFNTNQRHFYNRQRNIKTSFSIVKHTVFNYEDEISGQPTDRPWNYMPIQIAERLEKLKTDKFSGRIRIPYFEYEIEDNALIIQTEYIKGRPLVNKEISYIYDNIVCRSDDWSFLDSNTSNFVVDDFHYKDEISSPIYVIDLDTYQECSIEERKRRWSKDNINAEYVKDVDEED